MAMTGTHMPQRQPRKRLAADFELNVPLADAPVSVTVTDRASVTVVGSLIDAEVPEEEVIAGEVVEEEEAAAREEEEAVVGVEETPLGADEDSDPVSEMQLPTQKGLCT